MFKKKSSLSFKPKAPPTRQPGPQSNHPSTDVEHSATAERQSQTPGPAPSAASQAGGAPASSSPAPQAQATASGDRPATAEPPTPSIAARESHTIPRVLRSPSSTPAIPNASPPQEARATEAPSGAADAEATGDSRDLSARSDGDKTAKQQRGRRSTQPDAGNGERQSCTEEGPSPVRQGRVQEPTNAQTATQHADTAKTLNNAQIVTQIGGRAAPQSQHQQGTRKKVTGRPGSRADSAGREDGHVPEQQIATREVASQDNTTKQGQRGKNTAASSSSAAATPVAAETSGIPSDQGATDGQPAIPLSGSSKPPPKRQRKRKARAPGDGQPSAQGGDGEPPRPKRRKPTKNRPANTDTSGDGQVASQQEQGGPAQVQKKRQRKRPSSTREQGEAELDEGDDNATPRKRRKERSVTPDGAESLVINQKEVKLVDLVKEPRQGKKFSRHDELLQKQREKRQKYRLEKILSKNGDGSGDNEAQTNGEEPAAGARVDGDQDGTGAPESNRAAAQQEEPAPEEQRAVSGPQFEVINGEIVINQASLVHDRHAAAAAEAGEMEEVEENDFTRLTTSGTYLKPGKLRGPNAWTSAETEDFYHYLGMFGTDFTIITGLFRGKSRRAVKMKFNREELKNPVRINATLVGRKKIAIDVEEYATRSGRTLEDTADIEAEHRRREEEHQAEQKRIADAAAAELQKKRDELFGHRNGDGGGSGDEAAAAAAATPAEDGRPVARARAADGHRAAAKTPPAGRAHQETEEVEEIDETDLPLPRARGRRGLGRGRRKRPIGSGFGI